MELRHKNAGTLFIVATPIGNLQDITLRALDTLKQVDLVAAEDTRHSGKLLAHYGIKTKLIALHDYNEAKCGKFLCQELQQGKNIALIADAGTPLISDPGYHLIKIVQEHNLKVVPIPGACAAIAALSAAGLPTDKFLFLGFLPAKTGQQTSFLTELTKQPYTMIFYESPHRLLPTIVNMAQVFGEERSVVLAKELTKTFETIHATTLGQLSSWLLADPNRQKGEFVILVHGAVQLHEIDASVMQVVQVLAKYLPSKQAATIAAQITGVNKNQLYKLLLNLA